MSQAEGYEVACAIADDNLRVGRTVIADSVYPVEGTGAQVVHTSHRNGTSGPFTSSPSV